MKKWLVLLFILMFTFLVACTTGNDESSEGDSGSEDSNTEESSTDQEEAESDEESSVKVAARFSV